MRSCKKFSTFTCGTGWSKYDVNTLRVDEIHDSERSILTRAVRVVEHYAAYNEVTNKHNITISQNGNITIVYLNIVERKKVSYCCSSYIDRTW